MAKRKCFEDLEFAEQSSKFIINSVESNHPNVKRDNTINNDFVNSEICWFNLLPDEVLEHICSFLPIKSLIVLEELKCGRLSDSTLKTHFLDFSSCNDIVEVEKIFSAGRSHYVKKINFYHMFLVNTSSLLKATIKCKHLSSLSVIGCGFQLKEILQVLLKCPQLKELYWDVTLTDEVNCASLDSSPVNLKHLYLHLNDIAHLSIVCYLIRRCQSASSIFINTSTLQNSTCLLLNQTVSYSWFKLHKTLNCPTKILMSFLSLRAYNLSEKIVEVSSCCPNTEQMLSLNVTAPHLQLITRTGDFELPNKIESKTVREILLCVTNKEFLDRSIDKLNHIMRKHTELLSIHEHDFLGEDDTCTGKASNIVMSDLVARLVSNCCNIAHLIIPDTHFDGNFNFATLHVLTGLKTLNLTSCVFFHVSDDRSSRIQSMKQKQRDSFDLFVKTCKEVQNFTLTGCCACDLGPCDADLGALPHWRKLETLSLSCLKHVCFCPFLRKLPQLKSLQILSVGSGLVCQYLPNVIFLLAHSLKLMFLSINMDSIHVKKERFWKSIPACKTLQGMCVIMIAQSSVCSKLIVDAVKECPSLHLFHYNSPNVPENLEVKIRRAMKSNGIKQAKVGSSQDRRFSDFDFKPCPHPHFSVASFAL